MGIREDTIGARQIILKRRSSVSITVRRTGILEIPQQVLLVRLIVPELAGIVASGLDGIHSETSAGVRIKILPIILQPEAVRTAGAGLLLGSEGCFHRIGIIQRNLAVCTNRCGDALQLPGRTFFVRNDIHRASAAVRDQVLFSILKSRRRLVSDGIALAGCRKRPKGQKRQHQAQGQKDAEGFSCHGSSPFVPLDVVVKRCVFAAKYNIY